MKNYLRERSRMKIVHITTVHEPFDNRIFYKECLGMAKKGYKVTLIARHHQNETVQGIFIRALPKVKNRLFRLINTTFNAYKAALLENGDLYHFHDPEFMPLALLLKIKHRKKIVYDIHEDYHSLIKIKTYLPVLLRPIIANLFYLYEFVFSKPFVKVLAERYYMEKFPKGLPVLNYPNSNLLQYAENNIPEDRLNLIYTGNISIERGAIEHATLVNYFENVHVYLVGRCSEEVADRIYSLVGSKRERLFIVGIERFVPFSEIVDYYKWGNWTAGLALFPPNPHYVNKELTKFFEYMSFGIPVLCSDFPVWKKLIEETGSGLCVKPEDQTGLKSTLNYLFNNRPEAKRMGRNGRTNIKEHFNWENELAKLEKIYLEMINEKGDQ